MIAFEGFPKIPFEEFKALLGDVVTDAKAQGYCIVPLAQRTFVAKKSCCPLGALPELREDHPYPVSSAAASAWQIINWEQACAFLCAFEGESTSKAEGSYPEFAALGREYRLAALAGSGT